MLPYDANIFFSVQILQYISIYESWFSESNWLRAFEPFQDKIMGAHNQNDSDLKDRRQRLHSVVILFYVIHTQYLQLLSLSLGKWETLERIIKKEDCSLLSNYIFTTVVCICISILVQCMYFDSQLDFHKKMTSLLLLGGPLLVLFQKSNHVGGTKRKTSARMTELTNSFIYIFVFFFFL